MVRSYNSSVARLVDLEVLQIESWLEKAGWRVLIGLEEQLEHKRKIAASVAVELLASSPAIAAKGEQKGKVLEVARKKGVELVAAAEIAVSVVVAKAAEVDRWLTWSVEVRQEVEVFQVHSL